MHNHYFITHFSKVGARPDLRVGSRYRYFLDKLDATIFPESRLQPRRVGNLVELPSKNLLKKGALEEKRNLIDLENVHSKISTVVSEKRVKK